MKVEISENCGETWEPVYKKFGSDLGTITGEPILWKPTTPEHWRQEKISLEKYENKKVQVRFTNISAGGNSIWIDKVNIDNNVGSQKAAKNDENISILPNPSSGDFYVIFKNVKSGFQQIEIRNVLGKQVFNKTIENPNGRHTEHISIKTLPEGVYLLNITGQNSRTVKRVVIDR